jgi:hypothetical protein
MLARKLALTILAAGVVAFVAGVYGVTGPEFSILLAGSGLLALLFGTGFLLSAARPWRLSVPHPYVVGIAVAAAALHAYEHVYKSVGDPSVGFLLWAMVPYFLCLSLSAFPGTRAPVIAGGAVALAFDLWGHYSVFFNPKGSTAALALLFIPLWSTIIVVPLATFIAWSVFHRRRSSQGNAP